MRGLLLSLFLVTWTYSLWGQVTVQGTVYDRTVINGLQEVTINDIHGAIAVSDSLGHYSVTVPEGDTIYFSYLKKRTMPFPVKNLRDPMNFDVSIDAEGPAVTPIFITANSYHTDSLLNREENREIFDFQRQGHYVRNIRTMPGGAGLNLGGTFDMAMLFDHSVERSRESVQRWMITEEKDKYVDHRFNKAIVKRITGLDSADLRRFMRDYRPSYALIKSFPSDWEFYEYILESSKSYLEDEQKK
ncbi:hypothetical protein [Dinghuibacter silviterrae]|nr:hypothetical protein [Dinghuibacter silviterrae]